MLTRRLQRNLDDLFLVGYDILLDKIIKRVALFIWTELRLANDDPDLVPVVVLENFVLQRLHDGHCAFVVVHVCPEFFLDGVGF